MGAKTEPEVEKFLDTLIKKFSKNNSNISEEFEILLSEGRFEEVKLVSEDLIKSRPISRKLFSINKVAYWIRRL